MEVFGQTGYLHALDNTNIVSRMHENIRGAKMAKPLEAPISDAITYLTAVVRQQLPGDNDLPSLAYNMIVMEILDAEKQSTQSGKKVRLN